MTLTELRNSVYSLTNRPDLIGQTLLAIQAATLKLHQLDYFYKDLYEAVITFSTSDYLQQIEYRTLLPRWRSLKYLRKSDVDSSGDGKFFDIILPDTVLDSYQINREDVCYVAGNVVQIKSSTEFQYAILGVYLNPDIAEATYSSWIALDHPFCIVYEAAADVMRQIGKQEEATLLLKSNVDQFNALRTSNILAQVS